MKFNSIDNDGSKMNPGKQMPIHRLAELTPKDIQISISKLIIFYETNKSFPTQYRSLIWRYLLKLPENSEEFGMLVRKGPHPAFESTSKTFDLKSSDRCKSICSLLAHWSPILAEVKYLPIIVESFLSVYDQNDLATFETCMTIFMWWGRSWNVLLPNPPIHITSSMSCILHYFDIQLFEFFTSVGIDAGDLGWKLLSTFFSQIFSKENWCVLIDYVFLHFKDAKLMVLLPVAVLRTCRDSLLQLDTETAATRFISKEQTIRTSDVIELVSSMASACPLGLYYAAVSGCIEAGGGCDLEGKSTRVMGRLNMSNLYIQSTTSPTTSSSPSQYKSNSISYRSGNIRSANKSNYFNEKGKKVIKGHDSINQPSSDEQQQILKSMSMQAGKAMFPLPSGSYPTYNGRPHTVKDWELQKREAVVARHQEINGESLLLIQLRAKICDMEAKHAVWMQNMYAEKEAEIMKEHEAMKAEEERAALILAEEAQATRERLISLQALERLADEERAVVDLLKLQSKKKDQLREEHQKRMNHVSEHVDRHRQAAHEVDTFLVSHFQSLPVSLEESGVGDLISTRQVSVRDSDGSFVTARQSASSGNLASVRLQTTATVIAPTNTDIALNDTRCDNADEGNVYEKDDDKELSFLTTKTTLHSSLGRVSTAAQTDNLSMEQPTLQLESHLGSINPPSQESQTEPVTETVTPMKVQHRNQHTKSSFVMSPATLASTTAEVLALLESPIPVPIHVPVSSALNQSLPHSRMHTPLESHSLTKSSSKYIETPSNRNRKVTFASPKITPVTNPKATHVSSSKSIHTTPKSIQHSVSVETKENRQSTPASANQSYSTKSRSMSMSMSMVKTPHSAALKQPPMRISTYARTPYSAASSTGNRYTSSPSRVFSSTDTPVITSAADIDSTTPTVPSPISESASAFVTAQKFPSRRQKQHEELYHSYQSYQEQLAEASTPAHNIVAQSDMYADSPELLHLSSWSASCYPGMNMPDTPALKAALADSETTADSFQRYASAYSEHYSAAPLASLAELSDDESEYGFAPASENINSVQDEMLQVSNHDPETELDGQPHGDDDLDRIFDDVFETTDEDNNETEIDSDDLRVYYDSLQFSVKSKRTNETSFMPRDLSLLSLSTGTGTGSPNHYQVPANQNNGRVRAYDNLSLTQYGNEVVAEEVLRQLLINEQLTDNITLSASKASAAKRVASVAAARAIAAGRAAAQAFMSASAALRDASFHSTASPGGSDVVNTLVREQHKRDTLTNNPTSVLNRSAFEEMIQDGGIGPLHTSSW